MNAFHLARTVEAQSLVVLLPFLEERSKGRFVLAEKGYLARALQETVGDALLTSARDGRLHSVEIKAELVLLKSRNLFLETFSNRNLDDRERNVRFGTTPGWLWTTRADWLLYHFLSDDLLFIIDLFALRQWAFVERRIFDFEEKRQGKYEQANDTWGRCVPIAVLMKELTPTPIPVERISQFASPEGRMTSDTKSMPVLRPVSELDMPDVIAE